MAYLSPKKAANLWSEASRLLEDTRILITGDGEEDPYAKVLRIGVCPASLEWLLPEPLAALLHRHPKVIFDILGASFERVVQLLRNGGVDVAIGFEDAFAEWSDIKRTSIAAMHAVLFARKGHPILKRRTVSKSHFAKYDFVAPSDSRPYGSVIRELYEGEGVSWQRPDPHHRLFPYRQADSRDLRCHWGHHRRLCQDRRICCGVR